MTSPPRTTDIAQLHTTKAAALRAEQQREAARVASAERAAARDAREREIRWLMRPSGGG